METSNNKVSVQAVYSSQFVISNSCFILSLFFSLILLFNPCSTSKVDAFPFMNNKIQYSAPSFTFIVMKFQIRIHQHTFSIWR